MAGEIILDLTLKEFYARPRPQAFFDYTLPSSFSFPSGHALGSFCFYGIVAWLLASKLKCPAGAWSIRISAIFLIFLIGFSRVYLGVHYPTDVLAGYLTGFVWTATVISNAAFLKARKPR
jgi:undecaprenyl-diphosphatase